MNLTTIIAAIEKWEPELGSVTDISVYLAALMLLANAGLLFLQLTIPGSCGVGKRTVVSVGITELCIAIIVTHFLAFFYGGEIVANIQAMNLGEALHYKVKDNMFWFLSLQLIALVFWLICFLIVSGKVKKAVSSSIGNR